LYKKKIPEMTLKVPGVPGSKSGFPKSHQRIFRKPLYQESSQPGRHHRSRLHRHVRHRRRAWENFLLCRTLMKKNFNFAEIFTEEIFKFFLTTCSQ